MGISLTAQMGYPTVTSFKTHTVLIQQSNREPNASEFQSILKNIWANEIIGLLMILASKVNKLSSQAKQMKNFSDEAASR